jgi:hypothetical protein
MVIEGAVKAEHHNRNDDTAKSSAAVSDNRESQDRVSESAKPRSPNDPLLDNLLDEALEATFPGSDPVAISQPASLTARRRRKRKHAGH